MKAWLDEQYPIIEDAFNGQKLMEFLQALATDGQKRGMKVLLILDRLRVHHSRLAKTWLAEREDRSELFYLPSPELNPDERLNADLKDAMGSTVPVRNKAKLKAATTTHMQMLEQNPDRVRSCFRDPRVVAHAA